MTDYRARARDWLPPAVARTLRAWSGRGLRLEGDFSTWEQAAQAFTTAFQETLNLELQTGEITTGELQHASLLFEKYTDPVWNNKQQLKGPG